MAESLPVLAPAAIPPPPVLAIEKSPLELLLENPEKDNSNQQMYLITMARVIAAQLADGREYKDLSTLARADIGNATVSSFNNPLPPGISGGRMQMQDKVLLVIVFREQHRSTSFLVCRSPPTAWPQNCDAVVGLQEYNDA